ncbi:hypothetical protein D3C81_2198980 [compost metagenome]
MTGWRDRPYLPNAGSSSVRKKRLRPKAGGSGWKKRWVGMSRKKTTGMTLKLFVAWVAALTVG